MSVASDGKEEWISPEEASRLLGLSLTWVRHFVRHGEIRSGPNQQVSRNDTEIIAQRLLADRTPKTLS